MKYIIIISLCFFSLTGYSQKDSLPPKVDSVFLVLDGYIKFIYGKVSQETYELSKSAAMEYFKEFLKPKKK